jgi:hypothetical protein
VDNFRTRPAARPTAPEREFFPGRCYLAAQSSLVFGSDRNRAVRRAIFIFLRHDLCKRRQRRDVEERDSYVCPRAESVPKDDLIEIGELDRSTWEKLCEWKRRGKKRKKRWGNSGI